jgi:hypothetical protein
MTRAILATWIIWTILVVLLGALVFELLQPVARALRVIAS